MIAVAGALFVCIDEVNSYKVKEKSGGTYYNDQLNSLTLSIPLMAPVSKESKNLIAPESPVTARANQEHR